MRILVLLLSVVVNVTGCGDQRQRSTEISLAGSTMGTTYTVKLVELPDNISTDELSSTIEQLLETVNEQMSTYRPDSEISQFNHNAADDWFNVSTDTVHVVAEALRISRLSNGAFDVTVGPLVDIWNFGPQRTPAHIPSDLEIAEALAEVGYEQIETRDTPPALRKTGVNIAIDLSAIAKGFAVDRIAEHLDKQQVAAYMVEIGGEIRVKGTKANGLAWTIGIEAPVPNKRTALKAIRLNNGAMATSGDYRNYFEKNGTRYSHTIDPRTGKPIEHELASVSVIATTCMHADAMATALMVLGPEDGYNLAVKEQLAALLIIRKDEEFIEKATPAFEQWIAEHSTK